MTGTDAEAVVDLLVCYNEHLWRPSTCRTPEERHLGLITVTSLARAAPKTESESTADVRTDYNKCSRNVMLLRIDAYRKYEPFAHAQLADSSKRSFASKSSNSSDSSSSRTGTSIRTHP